MTSNEPDIIINDIVLSEGQCMTIRVAIESFAHDLAENGLGEDEHGLKMVEAYSHRIDQIRNIIFKKQREKKHERSC